MINNVNYNNSVRFSARSNQVKMLDRDGKFTGEVIGEEFKDADMPVYDFAEYMAEKMGFPDKESFFEYLHGNRELPAESPLNSKTVEINGQTYNVDDIPIAKVDLTQRFTPTGDPEQDRKLAAKYDYFDSCMDCTNAADFDELTANEDFTGMTVAEKYKAIFEKYQHCYGENFLEAGAVRYWASGVVERFNGELDEHCGKHYGSEIEKAHRELLYGSASNSEVRQKILDKYSENGSLTVRNLFKAVNEMCLSGVADGGLGGIYDTVLDRIESNAYNEDEYYREDHIELLIDKLDKPVTAMDCQKMLNTYKSRSHFQGASAEQGAAIRQIIEACGASLGGISVDSVSAASSKNSDFTWIKL